MFTKQHNFFRGKFKKFVLLLFLVGVSIEIILRISGYLYLSQLHYNNFVNSVNPSLQNINIVCLGESSTAGLWVDWNDSYPKQLEKKLRGTYKNDNIKIILPAHIGQNTSQISNRIESRIKLYRPRLIVVMAGANNEWCLFESNVVKFLHGYKKNVLGVKCLVFFGDFRLFKVLRYCYLSLLAQEKAEFCSAQKKSLLGDPQLTRWPIKQWVNNFAYTHENEFVELWRYDVQKIIDAAKKHHVKILLMTYPAPVYVSSKEFISMAEKNGIPLVRNDDTFRPIFESGHSQEYFCKDNWHPNKKGYSLIATNVFECIRKYGLLD